MTPPTTDAADWGNISQIASASVATLALFMSVWGIWRANNKAELGDLSRKIDSGNTALHADIASLRGDDARAFERIDRVEADMTGLKVEVKHLVTKDELHILDRQLARIDEKIDRKFEALSDKMDTVISQTERAQDRLAQREDSMIARLKDHHGGGA